MSTKLLCISSGKTLAVDLDKHWRAELALWTVLHEALVPLLDSVLVIACVGLQELHVSLGQPLFAGLVTHP